MAFILSSDGRDEDVVGCHRRYNHYLNVNKDKFPKSAYELASSDWYNDFNNHQCPHDSWLMGCEILEFAAGERCERRYTSLKIKLFASYHDGFIELTYPQVYSYRMSTHNCLRGHSDWRYEEFRLSEAGHVIHEIEWARDDKSTWLIEASDVLYQWIPRAESQSG